MDTCNLLKRQNIIVGKCMGSMKKAVSAANLKIFNKEKAKDVQG